jgi:hypothetical protein
MRRRLATCHSTLLAACLASLVAGPLAGQTLDDGFPVEPRQLRLTVDHGVDRWDHYWEGTRRRDNANLGTVSTRATVVAVGYGLTRRVGLFVQAPYIATRASQGTLAGQQGAQDLTVGAKWRAFALPVAARGALHGFVGGMLSTPMTDYSPDFLPLSIGLGARRAGLRGLLHYEDRSGLFVDAAITRHWRSTVTLDRPAYFTEDQLTLSDRVAMPGVEERALTIGLAAFGGGLCLPLTWSESVTLGGGDIRRQDMPFVSNRMNAQRLSAQAMIELPWHRALRVNAGVHRVLHGRNVGEGTMWTSGITYAFGWRPRGGA